MMSHNNYFEFKQFKVLQHNSAMKVGTDGALLGAWVSVKNVSTVLDIGTGTGIISLMMAQRTLAMITAIDIDNNAYIDASLNFQSSPWSDRLKVNHTSFQDFLSYNFRKFDCIVCNPPYFNQHTKPTDNSRLIARHSDLLPFDELINGASSMLNKGGHFSIIIPVDYEREIRSLAANYRLFVRRMLWVKPKPSKPFNRVLIEFAHEAEIIDEREISVETEIHHEYTPEFIGFLKDFYLYL